MYTLRLRAGLLAAALAVTAAPLCAQQPGTFEAGLFGRMSWFDQANPINNVSRQGIGARLGLFVLPNLELEASGSFSDSYLAISPDLDVNYIPLRGTLTYNFASGLGSVVPLIGVGVAHSRYSGAIDATNNGPTGLVGFKAYATDWAVLRTEATLDHIPSPFNNTERQFNWGWHVGLSFNVGAGRVSDSDHDGVRDNYDVCPNTQRDETVDPNGCPMDSDTDGVPDSADRCAGTPGGVMVDGSGCARDSDRDGVNDDMDACANTPSGARVESNGCARDFDGDGVADHGDRCPNTIRGASVDANGCPVDGDEDGVADGLDRCPNSTEGSEVDANGCPVLFDEESGETVLVLSGVKFESGSAALTLDAQRSLDEVAQSLVGNPDVRVEIGGHTDATGSRSFNLSLSQRRAEAVARYLVGRGVESSRLAARGYGPDMPASSNATKSGRQTNRRVELKRIN